ncbi:hypothetical protein E6W36_14580 [Hankyongella ginsenosidimutans]|uniref:Uncharacterized protein n=1 Tax=Hankyongella ginsenosidimutans TaxID=1763828 RepID=A0A4D7CCB9_9SPHN|nr:hypothetical protein [Hankyongella ginsenosidimutans]QCI80292.1 hypothetical protein E6W36_14580 [Hankyongella ginsenosidimutans]
MRTPGCCPSRIPRFCPESLTLERQADDVGGTRIFAKLPEPSEGFVLDEPATRQRLLVVPTTAASRGMLSAVRKPGGVFLPTLQGLAYEFIGDRPQTLRYPNGIAFLGIERKTPADEARGARKTLDGSLHKDRLVDLAAWAKLGDETMHARKVALLYALSMAGKPSGRPGAGIWRASTSASVYRRMRSGCWTRWCAPTLTC